MANEVESRLLLVSVFLVAAAGLVYELIAGTLATYLLGSSITVFSMVIGVFLAAMGLGAWLAQYARTNLAHWFVVAEMALAFVGGMSALGLFASYVVFQDGFVMVLGLFCIAIGSLVGLEIPILLRIVETGSSVRLAVSRVLAVDYVGALLGSVLFPLVLLPHLGLVRTAALLGLLNLVVAFVAIHILRRELNGIPKLHAAGAVVGLALLAVFATAGNTTSWAEDSLYQDPIVIGETTPYQRVVVTRWRDDIRLYLNGHLQFSSVDEHRYHEALVHPAISAAHRPKRVLVLGGGDGLAVRQLVKHSSIEHIDLVDLDHELLHMFQTHAALTEVNEGALQDPRVSIHAADAIEFVDESTEQWDVILMDLPDPNDDTLSRLYAQSTFRLMLSRLAEGGVLVTQATSPFFAPDAFWCIVETVETVMGAEQSVQPFHVNVPSFGEWGFVMLRPASDRPLRLDAAVSTAFLDQPSMETMFHFPRDMGRRSVEPNRLATAVLARYYRDGWKAFH